jgi:AcrR family transcriptional regulator
MPKQKFFNLRIKKQRRILEAMGEEFLKGSYAQFTVSGFIREAGISRASFYTYFNSKEDALSCMFKTMAMDAEEMLADTIRRGRGRFENGMERLFWFLIKTEVGRKYHLMYRRVLEDEGCRSVSEQIEREYYREENWRRRGRNCLEALDRLRYSHLDETGMACAVDMGITIVHKAVMLHIDRQAGFKELWETVRIQLSILEQGIRNQ